MTFPDIKRAPAQPISERNLALNFFHAQLEKIKSGKINRYDLATFDRDWDGQVHLYTPAQRIIDGVKLFSDTEIKAAVGYLIDELTGEINGWRILDSRTREKPQTTDTGDPRQDVLTWEFLTLVKGVKVGVERVVDQSGEVGRTYYLVNSRS